MCGPELHLGGDIVLPSLAGWRQETLPVYPDGAIFEIAPDWICEVLSPSTASIVRHRKADIYARAGVGHLWLVDPAAGILEVIALRDGQRVVLATLAEGDPVAQPPFEAATFALDALWPELQPPPPAPDVIAVGDIVRVRYLSGTRSVLEVTLSDRDHDPDNGVLGVGMPLGKALLGGSEGEEIEIPDGSYIRRAIVEKVIKIKGGSAAGDRMDVDRAPADRQVPAGRTASKTAPRCHAGGIFGRKGHGVSGRARPVIHTGPPRLGHGRSVHQAGMVRGSGAGACRDRKTERGWMRQHFAMRCRSPQSPMNTPPKGTGITRTWGFRSRAGNAQRTWKEIRRLADRHQVAVEVRFQWNDNEKAQHPGRVGVLRAGDARA